MTTGLPRNAEMVPSSPAKMKRAGLVRGLFPAAVASPGRL